jgi:uncharacterized protein YegP (UPF0339 family)
MFELIFNSKKKHWYFRLKAKNHKVILQSETYKTKRSALRGIKAIQDNANSVIIVKTI